MIVAFLRYLVWGTITPFAVDRLVPAGLLIVVVGADVPEPTTTDVAAGS